MKRSFLGLIAALLLCTAAHAAAPTKFIFTWGYTPNTSVPICTTAVTVDCVNQFILTEPVTGVVLTIPAVAGTTTYTVSTPLPPQGTYTYTLVASETTGATTSIPSAPVTVSLQSPQVPGPADHFTGTPQ